jgi:hypothetical protein
VGVGGLLTLHDVPRAGKGRSPIGADHAAGVVIVKVADDDDVDAGRVPAGLAERRRRVAALDALDVALLVVEPHAGSRLGEHALPTRLDQEAVQPVAEPAAVVDLRDPRPERPRDDAEEAARIRPEPPGPQQSHAHVARERPGAIGRRQLVDRLGMLVVLRHGD